MTIDIERLKVDREYWDKVAPDGANRYYNNSHYQCFLKHSSLDHLYHLSSGEWWPIPLHAIQSHLDCSFPRPEPRQMELGGLPESGVDCEMQDEDGAFIAVHIIANFDGFAFGWSYDRRQVYFSDKPKEFRPIRTKEQREVFDLECVIQEAYERGDGGIDFNEFAKAIIAAGWRKEQ